MFLLPLKAVINPPLLLSLRQPPSDILHPQNGSSSTINRLQMTSSLKPISYSLSFDHSHPLLTNSLTTSATYGSILDSCTCSVLGKSIHGQALKNGFHGHQFVETKLVQMYAKNGCLSDAYQLFDEMAKRNLYSWLAVISVHVEYELYNDAIMLFIELLYEDVRLDFFVFPVVLKICSSIQQEHLGKQVHGFVLKTTFISNVYVGNALTDMYGKCGLLDDSKKVFSKMNKTDSVSWNCLLPACALNGMVHQALEYLYKMSTLADVVSNVVSWSTVISGFTQNGYASEAIKLFSRMRACGVEQNAQTSAGILPAFAKLESPYLAKDVHACITGHEYMTNSIVVSGLLDVYRRCGDMENARKLFSRFSVKNIVSFNSMIVGFCETVIFQRLRVCLDRGKGKEGEGDVLVVGD